MGIDDDDRETIFKYVWSLSYEQKGIFVKSLIEKDDVARRMGWHASKTGVKVFRKQKTFSYFLKVDNSQQRKVCRTFSLVDPWFTDMVCEKLDSQLAANQK